MTLVAFGIAPFVVWLGMAGGAGLPLGVPPMPEDKMCASVAPEECLAYVSWAGMARPNAQSANNTEKLLAEPQVQQMLAVAETTLREAAINGARNAEDKEHVGDAFEFGKLLLTRPTAIYLTEVKGWMTGVPDVRGGVLVNVGDEAAKVTKALATYHELVNLPVGKIAIDGVVFYRLNMPNVPTVTVGVRDNYFVVAVGDDELEAMFKRGKGLAPKWLADLRKSLPVDRVSTISYVNIKGVIDRAGPMAGPMVGKVLSATGLDGVTHLASITGLDSEGFVSKSLIGTQGELRGLLKLAAKDPIVAADLAGIPANATFAVVAKCDVDEVLQTVLEIAEKIEPRAKDQFLRGLGELDEKTGLKVKDDVLKSLGDTWRVFDSPNGGGLLVGTTAVVSLKQPNKLTEVSEKFVSLLKERLGQNTDKFQSRRQPRIEKFDCAGQKVYCLQVRERDFPFAPTWSVTDKELVVGLYPQAVTAYLTSKPTDTLAKVPQVAAALAEKPISLSYLDEKRLFELVYPALPVLNQFLCNALQREEGVELNQWLLPPASAISSHLTPAVSTVRRSEAGIESTTRHTLPVGGGLGVGPMFLGGLMPMVAYRKMAVERPRPVMVVQAEIIPMAAAEAEPQAFNPIARARRQAQRAASMNNLKQIAVAMIAFENDKGTLPARYSAKAGKPLLSWRVHLLPYLEQKDLYGEFKLDEPWDSDHNKRLIAKMPKIYQSPLSNAKPGMTTYLTVGGKDTVFAVAAEEKLTDLNGSAGIKVRDIPDGMSNTILVVEAADAKAIEWTKPDALDVAAKDLAGSLVEPGAEGFLAAFCDGHIEVVPAKVSPEVLQWLFKRNDGNAIPEDRTGAKAQ